MARIRPNKLLISEMFHSVQGEGKTTGVPAVFIRLTNCNLSCGFSPQYLADYKKDKTHDREEAGNIVSDLMTENKATWCCDSMPVWINGKETEFSEVIEKFEDWAIYDRILDGTIHIIWTGGEPTIPGHQKSIVNFNNFWVNTKKIEATKCYVFSQENSEYWKTPWHQEIETNGTYYIETGLFEILNQINCSPKLSNSGMSKEVRIVPKAINRIMEHENYQFKFVVSDEDDIFEMFDTYINPFNIPLKNVVCMPAMTHQSEFFERTKWCLEMAKKYHFIGLTRMHIAAWDSACGV